jgi:nucleoside-diphosphate-sugar epimerase
MDVEKHSVFVTGGTGYLGRPLISTLIGRGHEVRGLTRPGSQAKLPAGCQAVLGNALNNSSYRAHQCIGSWNFFRPRARALDASDW